MFGISRMNSLGKRQAASSGPTYNVIADMPNVNEGGSTFFTLTTTAPVGILYIKHYINGVYTGALPTANLDGDANMTISGGTGTASVFPAADFTTEGAQSLYLEFYTDSGFTNLVATSPTITINDTSTSPPTLSVFTTKTQTTSGNFVLPTGIQAGDIAVFFDHCWNGSTTAPVVVTPSGFTGLNAGVQITTPASRVATSYKICAGTEGGTTVSSMTGAAGARKLMIILRRSAAWVSAPTVTAGTTRCTSAAPTAATWTLGSSPTTKPNYVFAFYGCTNATLTTRTSSRVETVEYAVGTNFYIKVFQHIGETSNISTTFSMTDYGSNAMGFLSIIMNS